MNKGSEEFKKEKKETMSEEEYFKKESLPEVIKKEVAKKFEKQKD